MKQPRKLHAVPRPVDKDAVKMLETLLEGAKRGEWTGIVALVIGPENTWCRAAGRVPRGEALLLLEDFKNEFVHKR